MCRWLSAGVSANDFERATDWVAIKWRKAIWLPAEACQYSARGVGQAFGEYWNMLLRGWRHGDAIGVSAYVMQPTQCHYVPGTGAGCVVPPFRADFPCLWMVVEWFMHEMDGIRY